MVLFTLAGLVTFDKVHKGCAEWSQNQARNPGSTLESLEAEATVVIWHMCSSWWWVNMSLISLNTNGLIKITAALLNTMVTNRLRRNAKRHFKRVETKKEEEQQPTEKSEKWAIFAYQWWLLGVSGNSHPAIETYALKFLFNVFPKQKVVSCNKILTSCLTNIVSSNQRNLRNSRIVLMNHIFASCAECTSSCWSLLWMNHIWFFGALTLVCHYALWARRCDNFGSNWSVCSVGNSQRKLAKDVGEKMSTPYQLV